MERKSRLSPNDWIRIGFDALLDHGPGALRAEALARDLGTTKGSFYWHFEDVPAFQSAMLSAWKEAALAALELAAQSSVIPAARLRTLAQVAAVLPTPALSDRPLDPAIRAWAQADDAAAAALARVDSARLETLGALLSDMGITNPEIARLVLGAGIGLADLARRDGAAADAAIGSLVDLILALR